MKLKELINEEGKNILDFISFFDAIEDTKPYFSEMCFLYGNREVLNFIEELYLSDGLGAIGLGFELKSEEWGNLKNISQIISNESILDSEIVTTSEKTDTIVRTGETSNTSNDTNYVVPYDSEEETNTDALETTSTTNNTENVNNTNTGNDVRTYRGFNKDKLNYLKSLFNDYPKYRYSIYKDIVNMLCLQIYDFMI